MKEVAIKEDEVAALHTTNIITQKEKDKVSTGILNDVQRLRKSKENTCTTRNYEKTCCQRQKPTWISINAKKMRKILWRSMKRSSKC